MLFPATVCVVRCGVVRCVVMCGVVWCVVWCGVVGGGARCGVVRCVLVWLGLVCGVWCVPLAYSWIPPENCHGIIPLAYTEHMCKESHQMVANNKGEVGGRVRIST